MKKRRILSSILAFTMLFSTVFGSMTPAGHVHAEGDTETAYSYMWEWIEDSLVSVEDETYTQNTLTTGSDLTNGTYYKLSDPVELSADKEWSVEWKIAGEGNAMLLTSMNKNDNGNIYVYRNNNSLVCIGERISGKSHNYGFKLSEYDFADEFDYTEEHVYRIQNEVTDDGNVISLYVDGELLGPMNDYYIASNSQNSESDYLYGKDYTFSYLGNKTAGLDKDVELAYIKVVEDMKESDSGEGDVDEGHIHQYSDWIVVTEPSKDLVGTKQRSCGCGDVQEIEFAGVWGEPYNLGDYLQELPEEYGSNTNLWNELKAGRNAKYFAEDKWADGGDVCSVTIPVKAGDKLSASSFGLTEGKEGIAITFFDNYGVLERRLADATYEEFTTNEYVTVPEGAIAVCVPMRTDSDEWDLHFVGIPEVHEHQFSDWTEVKAPTEDAPGIEQRSCACGEVEAREVNSVWQTCSLGDYLLELPENLCSGINLWNELKDGRNDKYYAEDKWADGGDVCSVTIPVKAGDKLSASSFGLTEGKEGIAVTFFDKYGVLERRAAAEIYTEFTTNGYVTVPESAIAVCVPMRTNSDEWNLHFAGLEHHYVSKIVEATCTEDGYTSYTCTCGESYKEDRDKAIGHKFTNYVSNNDATHTADGTKTASCDHGCGTTDTIADPGSMLPGTVIAMKYDDHMDIAGKDVEIIDSGKPTSYQVGHGVTEGELDTDVVAIDGNNLVATGIGTAKVSIDGEIYDIRVSAAPISLLLLIGQSNMQGSEGELKGEGTQSIICEDGQVYATYGSRYDMTVSNATNYAASALTGKYSSVNVNGTTNNISGYPINSLNEAGDGKAGPDSGIAYQWAKATGEKVWVVNAAHGGTSISKWQKGASEYEEAVALFGACQDTLQKEIAAGHYKLSYMGYFWCQGCTDEKETAEWYVNNFLAMHENLKKELAFDADSNPSTADVKLQFANIILTLAGHDDARGYRFGGYETGADSFFTSFEELEMRGQRVAQYWLAANPELEDINLVCNLGDSWVTMPDGSDGVAEYFADKYENGKVDYKVQVTQDESWYTPTTPEEVKDNVHYNQIGYNEIGMEAAQNALYLLGEVKEPEVETTVTFYNWTGFEETTEIGSYADGCSDTLVVPVVSPCYMSKQVSYEVSDGLEYNYYDLIDTAGNGGTLRASLSGSDVVTVKETVGNYLWESSNSELENIVDNIYYANPLTKLGSSKEYYKMAKIVNLKSDKEWLIEWSASGSGNTMLLSGEESNTDGNIYLYRNDKGIVCLGYKDDNGSNNYGLNLNDYNINPEEEHLYCIKNVIADGRNMLYLYVDDEEIGPMNQYFLGSTLQNTEDEYLSGKNFVFRYIGNNNYPVSNITLNSLRIVCDGTAIDSHVHKYSDWEVVSVPSAEGPGLERRSCTGCEYVQEREVDGVWQKYELSDHISELPEDICCETNLWSVLKHDKTYFTSSEKWSKNQYSITIPVNGGDTIAASSFGEAGTNGGSKNGIAVTFFSAYGVLKRLTSEETYAEFSTTGYLTVPEGAIAVNIPMWSNSSDWKVYISNLEHDYDASVTEPGCVDKGYTTYTCKSCERSYVDNYVNPIGHDKVIAEAVEATCTQVGLTEGSHCSRCDVEFEEQIVIPKLPHKTEVKGAKEATCTKDGYTGDKVCTVCSTVITKGSSISKKGHTWDEGVITAPATAKEPGEITYTCTVCKETKMESVSFEGIAVERVWGASRYMTSLAIADELKKELGVDKFNAVIIASGENFPDALAGSYLAAKKNAPILMVDKGASSMTLVQNYIEKNLTEKGKVYILGGSAAVSETIEKNLENEGYDVERLKGKDRYGTNIAILNEAGVTNEEILVCTGKNFADSLSASAAGLPILLVNPDTNKLTDEQKAFFNGKGCQISIIGGEAAVSDAYKSAFTSYDADKEVERVKGKTRYETSVEVAKAFCDSSAEAVIAYALKFPDGLCGGPLAYAKKAPLILTAEKDEDAAESYITNNNISIGTVLGGSGVLPDNTVKKVFGMTEDDQITGTRYE